MTEQTADSVEEVLRKELVRGDAVLATARPVLRHLLANDDAALFSDELVARVRGMMTHVAAQLLFAQAAAAQAEDRAGYVAARQDELAQALFEDTALLAHAHALTLEAQLAERLQGGGIDAVLSPLVEELVAASDAEMATLAMALLAAQARFVQQHRRMELPLSELPGDLLHKALLLLREGSPYAAEHAAAAERALRERFDEGSGRIGLLTRLVMAVGDKAVAALAVDHAGVAIFATALAMASNQNRDLAVLSFADRHTARLALALRAAGLEPKAVEEQFLFLQPTAALPDGFDRLGADRAVALLAGSP